MHNTFIQTPFIGGILERSGRLFLRLAGWRIDGDFPDVAKCVVVAAPHTSNWDFPFALAIFFASGTNCYWMGKDSLFPFGLGWFMKWLGGIPVDRRRGHSAAAQAIQAFKRSERLIILIPPEGTRSRVDHWKKGFHLIARGANVPVLLGYLDYAGKRGGFGPLITPSDDFEADMSVISSFYSDKIGKHPEQTTLPAYTPGH